MSAKRARPIRKLLSFSEQEWARVDRRMTIADAQSFDKFGRAALLDAEIRVERVAFDPTVVRAELARIGNNINQIARHVNAEDAVTLAEMQATRALLRQVQRAIEQATKAGGDEHGNGGDASDKDDDE